MHGYFCIRFLVFMLREKNLLDYINLFSPNEYGKNDKTVLECFYSLETKKFFLFMDSKKVTMKKIYCINCNKV